MNEQERQAERARIDQALQAALTRRAGLVARDDLLAFARFMRPDPNKADDPEATTYVTRPHHQVLAEALMKVASGEFYAEGYDILCISIGPQKGKLLADDTLVLTGAGWKRHGDLRAGDVVFGPDGNPCAVLAVGEPDSASLRVTFTDGSSIDAHPRHEWTVYDKRSHHWRTVETQWMLEQGLFLMRGGVKRESGRKSEMRFAVPPISAIDMPDRSDLPVEPYALGAWLGDGTAVKPCITHAERDMAVVDAVAESYPRGSVAIHKGTGVYTTYFTGDGGLNKASSFTRALRDAGVIGDKHIPAAYFTASMAQRLQLLAGLIDTDGCVHKRTNRWGFSNANKRLVDDVARLIATFGWRATMVEYPPRTSSSGIVGKKTVWQVTFSPDRLIPTRLARKQVESPKASRRMRGICKIERIEPKVGRCIQVSRMDGLYCVGDALIPTHNSELCSRMFPSWFMGRFPEKNLMLGTYGDSFAWEFGSDVRAIMESPRYSHCFPKTKLKKGSRAKDFMQTEHGGKMSFVGRGGAGTGKPADVFLIDDPFKNAEEAASAVIRESVWKWFTQVATTRCHGLSVRVIIQTRWSEDDLIGRLTDKTNRHYDEEIGKRVMYINLPSLVESEELAKALKVPVGGSIWEDKFPAEMLRRRRKLDPIAFDAMEMGRPTPPEGAFFKRDDILVHNSPHSYPKLDTLRFYGSTDLALTPEIHADSSVIMNAGVDPDDDIWIWPDLFWDKVAADASVEALMRYCKQYQWFDFFGEKGQIARAVGPFLEKRAREAGLTALTRPTLFPTTGNKGGRATAIRGRMTQRRVHFPGWAPWWPRALDQMLKFTGSGDDKEDDFCDALGLLGQGLMDVLRGSAPIERKDNVIRVGTMAWVKHAHNLERAQERKRAALRGM